MEHELKFLEETKTDVVFQCIHCEQKIGFNKPGTGEPAALFDEGVWFPDPDFAKYLNPCIEG